jgi:dienelactone hydrolase
MFEEKVVTYREADTRLTGLLIVNSQTDENEGHKRHGIVVIHGGAGLDDHAKGRARTLAALGFVVFAADMFGHDFFGDGGHRQVMMARVKELAGDPAKLRRRAQAAVDVLAAHPLVDGRLAAVGYCFGGMAVLELARGGGELRGVVSIHGSLKTAEPARQSAVKPKVLVCHGALDPHVSAADVMAFMAEMNAAGADWQLNVYGGAMHGFTHEHAARQNIPGVAYNAQADARSFAAMRAFLGEVFGS